MRTVRHLTLKQDQGFSGLAQNQMLKLIFSVFYERVYKQDKNCGFIWEIKLNQETYVF